MCAGKRALFPAVLTWVEPDNVLVAGRQLCCFTFLFGVLAKQACCCARHHEQVGLTEAKELAQLYRWSATASGRQQLYRLPRNALPLEYRGAA